MGLLSKRTNNISNFPTSKEELIEYGWIDISHERMYLKNNIVCKMCRDDQYRIEKDVLKIMKRVHVPKFIYGIFIDNEWNDCMIYREYIDGTLMSDMLERPGFDLFVELEEFIHKLYKKGYVLIDLHEANIVINDSGWYMIDVGGCQKISSIGKRAAKEWLYETLEELFEMLIYDNRYWPIPNL